MTQTMSEQKREELREHHERGSAAFWGHVERLMEERGIEDLEELHRRYVETEYAYVAVPGLHRNKPVSLELFRRLVVHRDPPRIYAELLHGLREVFGLSEEGLGELMWFYLWGGPLPDEVRERYRQMEGFR